MAIIESTWGLYKEEIKCIEPAFYRALSQDLPDDQRVYIDEYDFGEQIVKDRVYLRTQDHPELNYSRIPLGITFKKDFQVIAKVDQNHELHLLYKNHNLLGMIPFVEKKFKTTPLFTHSWNGFAGTKYLVSAQKLTNKNKLIHLQKQLDVDLRDQMQDKNQFDFFKVLSDKGRKEHKWKLKILLLPSEVYKNVLDGTYLSIQEFIVKEAFEAANFSQTSYFKHFNWNFISSSLSGRGFKLDVHTYEVLNHLLLVLSGYGNGFRSIVNNDSCPIDYFKSVINEHYKPVYPLELMQCETTFFSDKPIYYSLNFPLKVIGTNLAEQSGATLYKNLENLAHVFDLIKRDKVKGYAEFNDMNFYSKHASSSSMDIKPLDQLNTGIDQDQIQNSLFFRNCIEIIPK